MVFTGGENVYSGEVEAVIYKHPAVREVAVFGNS
jgi:acyl-CoA synthetase (AMP-forming)/AMP-acid ligase II